jgi:hypothetical protein
VVYADTDATRRLMRIARAGGAPEQITLLPDVIAFRCETIAPSPCIIEEVGDQPETSVKLLDAVAGVGKTLFCIPAASSNVAPSPTVDRLEYVPPAVPGRPRNIIRVVTTSGTIEREITAAGATALNSLDYTAVGTGFFTSDYSTDLGVRLLHVSMDGKVTVLWNNRGSFRTWGVLSPDGKWIALLGATQESNVWVLEGF